LVIALLPTALIRGECATSLVETCQKLEQQASAETFQEAVNDCDEVIHGKCRHLLDEEDSLVLERFYHSYAGSLQRLAARIENQKQKAELDSRALDQWEQYFEWLGTLPRDERDRLFTSPTTRHGKKMFAAAAAIGISALATGKPESAYVDYEGLEPDYFGSDAINWWFASLFYPDQPGVVDDAIFKRIAAEPRIIAKHCNDPDWKKHWSVFVQKVMSLNASKRWSTSRETYIRRIDLIVRPNGPENSSQPTHSCEWPSYAGSHHGDTLGVIRVAGSA
jgi:hypothetical protein